MKKTQLTLLSDQFKNACDSWQRSNDILEKKIEDGFAGIIKRLDITNGKVLASKEFIDQNKHEIEGIPILRGELSDIKVSVAKWAGIITGIGVLINLLISRNF